MTDPRSRRRHDGIAEPVDSALPRPMKWKPPDRWGRILAVDAHTAGEPLRVIVEGFPELPGETMLEKRKFAMRRCDDLRKTLMWEPRGHADMYGCVLTPPVSADGHLGVLFMHNEGFSTMCGHGIIGLVKVGIECGLIPAGEDLDEIRIDTPAGRVTAFPFMKDGRVERVSFRNVPSFLLKRDLRVEVEGLGPVVCDVAFGGAFYAYVDAASLGLELEPSRFSEIVQHGRSIKKAVQNSCSIVHPEGSPDLNFLYGAIFVRKLDGPAQYCNVCVFADGEVDRSPTGTGVSGLAAILHARGQLTFGERISVLSLIQTRFEVAVLEETTVGGLPAVVPEVQGSAFITGRNEILVDPDDPLREGFLLR